MSDARKYFNSEFLEKTFSDVEQNQILTTDVKTKDNEKYKTNGGNDTKDKVFLLSMEEVKKYFKKDDMAAKNKNGEYQDWTLRTAGAEGNRITKVTPDFKKQNADGTYDDSSVDFDGWCFTSNANTYRPAMWVNLKGGTSDKVESKKDTNNKEETKSNTSDDVKADTANASKIKNNKFDASIVDQVKQTKVLSDFSGNETQYSEMFQDYGSFTWVEEEQKSFYDSYKLNFGKNPYYSNKPIEWLVLEKDGDKALLLSKYSITRKEFNKEDGEVSWVNCTIRDWLNSDFIDECFSSDESKLIITTNVVSSNGYTDDKLFFLSVEEVKKYFSNIKSNNALRTTITDEKIITMQGNTTQSKWWLRDIGTDLDEKNDLHRAAVVAVDGEIDTKGEWVEYGGDVRPAMWISLTGEISSSSSSSSGNANSSTKKEIEAKEENEKKDDDSKSNSKKLFSGWDNDSYYKDGKKITNEWVEEDKKWYYLKSNGKYAKSEWVKIKGEYYYFDNKGAMVSNQWVENKYYVGSDGKMLKNTITPDGFLVGADGTYVPQNTAVANNTVASNTANTSAVANTTTNTTNASNDTTGVKATSNKKVKTFGKYNEGLVRLYNTVKEGKAKEYKEAKFDKTGRLWMYRPISNVECGIMIYTAVDKKTYYFCNEDIPSYAKDGQVIKDEDGEAILNEWNDMDDEYEIDAENAEE